MAIRPKTPKKKKNPFRLSSDRQPGIAKANKGTKKKSRRFGGPGLPNPFGPRQTPAIPKEMEPYRPMPKKGIEDFLKKLEKQQKNPQGGPKLTPSQRERLLKLKEQLKKSRA